MRDSVRTIRSCVLYPDHSCLHLRQLAENMAKQAVLQASTMDSHSQQQELETAAEAVARFVYLLWGSAGPDEYGPRTYGMLISLQNRMRGMWTEGTWEYALAAFGCDIRSRLKQAENITIAPETATALREQFFDSLGNHGYLHEVVGEIMDLPWKQRRGLGAIPPDQIGESKNASIPRGDPEMERRLKWLASEALAMYIEQANIARGNIEHPTDPMIVLRDRIAIQLGLGGRDPGTWEESGSQIADLIKRRFGTAAARKEALAARVGWKSIAEHRKHYGAADTATSLARRSRLAAVAPGASLTTLPATM